MTDMRTEGSLTCSIIRPRVWIDVVISEKHRFLSLVMRMRQAEQESDKKSRVYGFGTAETERFEEARVYLSNQIRDRFLKT